MAATANPFVLNMLATELRRYAYTFASEKELHAGISTVLKQLGLMFEHEYVAGPKDRFDFRLDDGIVIEAKIDGSMRDAMEQITRYAKRDDVSAVVVVAVRSWARDVEPRIEINGKPVLIVQLKRQAF